MKKIGVLFLFLFLVSGCGKAPKEIERGMMLRSALLQGNGCSFEADITADYGDQVHNFSVFCQGSGDGDLSFTVTAPETISGITGTITDEGGMLTFDGMALQFDPMTDKQITPVIAPWILLKTLRSGYLTSACVEGDLLRLSIDDSYEEDALHLDIWLDGNNAPIEADILYNGRRIVALRVEKFALL